MYKRQNIYSAYVKPDWINKDKLYLCSLDTVFLLNDTCHPTVLYYVGGNNVFNLYPENILICHNFIPIIRQQQCMLAKMTNEILSIPLHNSDTNVIDYINGLL